MLVFKPRLAGIIALLFGFFIISTFTAGPATARDWLVPSQAPTVQAAIDSCVTGDVIVLAAGTYDDCTNPNGNNVLHIGVLISGVSLRGETGNPEDVILDAGAAGRCLELRNLTGSIIIENVTLRRGLAANPFGSGGGAYVFNSSPTFRNCVFDSCGADFAGGGISVSHGGLTVENCVFNKNFSPNIGAAIRAASSETTISGSTIYGSTGSGIHYSVDEITISNTIIAGGDDQALVQNSDSDPDPVLSCVNIHGNDVDYDEVIADQNGQDGNISLDPLFCSPLTGELTLYAASPCAVDNAGSCGQIGALPVACGEGAQTHIVLPDGTGSFPTIQSAINAAAVGDTVALADGTFTGEGNRDLDFLGKAITVKGLSGDPELAVIDCEGTSGDPHRGFIFQNEEAGFSILRDVTVTNGWVDLNGAAVLCESSPIFINCNFNSGHADHGAGIFCDGGSPQIIGCTFESNEGRVEGGGIGFFSSEAHVTKSIFRANWGSKGGAIFLPDSSSVTLDQCTLVGNFSSVDKACVGVDGNSDLSIENSIISSNNRMALRQYGTGEVTIAGSNVFENADGDYADAIAGQNGNNGNISADPIFCDAEALDFTLRGDSPCTDYNAPNGELMGAFPVGCEGPDLFLAASGLLPGLSNVSWGASWADINNDGNLDVTVVNTNAVNEVLLGDGAGVFTPFYAGLLASGGNSLGAAFGDINNDGDVDLYFDVDEAMNLMATNSNGFFTFVLQTDLQIDRSAGHSTWVDYNNDGNLDLYIVSPDTAGLLMTGNGEGGFSFFDSNALEGTEKSTASAWCDFNNDGFRDLYVVQDQVANMLFINEEGIFSVEGDVAINYSGAGKSAAWGDYDNDGKPDLYLVNDGEANKLLRNKGNGNFEDVTSGALADDGPGRSGIWGDWDNDGDLDLFLTNKGTRDRLLRNDGDGSFYDVGGNVFAATDSSTGCSFGDYDGNGSLDLLVAVSGDSTRIFRNQATMGRHYLKLDLTRFGGMAGAPGARVRLVTPDSLVQVREVGSSSGFHSSDPMIVHFGLKNSTSVDSLVISWPGGAVTRMQGIDADQLLQLTEPEGGTVPAMDDGLGGPLCQIRPCYPNPFNPSTLIDYRLGVAGLVVVQVYDVAGHLVKTIVHEQQDAGWHQVLWRGRDKKDRSAAAGVYFILVETQGQIATRSVTLLK